MAISPVSNVVSRNSYNNIAFEGNKKNQNKAGVMKSLPVVVLLAMSPAALSNAAAIQKSDGSNVSNIELVENSNISEQKSTDNVVRKKELTDKEGNKCTVKFISNNNDNVINKIAVSNLLSTDYIEEYKNVMLRIVGDDGVPSIGIKFPQLAFESRGVLSSSDVTFDDHKHPAMKYIKDFIDGKVETDLVNKAVKVKDIDRSIRPGSDGDLQNVPSSTDWVEEGKKIKENFGQMVKGTRPVSITNNDGTISALTAYNSDGGDEKVDFVTIYNMPNGSEFKIAGLRTSQVKLVDVGGEIVTFTLKTIEVYKRNSNQKAIIINDKMFDLLLSATVDPRFDAAVKRHPVTASEVRVYASGIVSPVN